MSSLTRLTAAGTRFRRRPAGWPRRSAHRAHRRVGMLVGPVSGRLRRRGHRPSAATPRIYRPAAGRQGLPGSHLWRNRPRPAAQKARPQTQRGEIDTVSPDIRSLERDRVLMPTVRMPAFRARICGNALCWIEVGDWTRCRRPVLPLSDDSVRALSRRLCDAYWQQLQNAKGADEARAARESIIAVDLTEQDVQCIMGALEGVLRELDNDPIEMQTVIAGEVELTCVPEALVFVRSLAQSMR